MDHGNHDGHYVEMGIEPIRVMEERLTTDNRSGPSTLQAFHLALALKHVMRAGRKEGQPWRKEIEKAQNYLNRALTGEWLKRD